MQREMVPTYRAVLLYGLKTLFGIDSMKALPALLFSDEALMPLVAFKAQHVCQGVCQRGAAKRQGERTPGPMSPDTLANTIVKLHVRDLEFVFNGAIRVLARAKVFGTKVTSMADGTDLETTERDTGCGQVTRKRRIEDRRGREHGIESTVYGWNVLLLIDAAGKIPLAIKVGKIQEHGPPGLGPWSPKPGPSWPARPACTTSSLTGGFGMARICGGWTSMASPWSCLRKTTGR
jgi:hypothetical protein